MLWVETAMGCKHLIWAGKQIFGRFCDFDGIDFGLYSLGPKIMWLCCYITWDLESPRLTWFEPSPWVLFFPMHFLVSTQKPKQTFRNSKSGVARKF